MSEVWCTCGCILMRIGKSTESADTILTVYEDKYFGLQDNPIRRYFKRLWSAITGKEYLLFEIVLNQQDAKELADRLNEVEV